MSVLGENEKKCKDCGELKPVSEFWRRKQFPDGLALYCKECFGNRNAVSYRKKQAAIGKASREYRRHSAVPEGMKYCPQCKEIKDVSDFGHNRANSSGRANYCKPCHNRVMAELKAKKHGSFRNYHLKRRYGVTEGEVAELSDRHAGRCLICLRRRPLHVDHDHATGMVRGLLCFPCNGAGQFKDDPKVIRRAVDYLEGRILEPYYPARGSRRRGGAKKSRRHYRLTQRYGIGVDELQALIDRQGESCPICGKAQATAVDHDHVSGAIRGILCADCNTGMGQLRDDSWVLRRAIEYLTGGLSGIQRNEDGRYAVTVVRPRNSTESVDPGWALGRACTDDLAFLGALARGDSGEPWETEVAIGNGEAYEPRFAILDLREPVVDEPAPAGPLGPPQYVTVG